MHVHSYQKRPLEPTLSCAEGHVCRRGEGQAGKGRGEEEQKQEQGGLAMALQ